MEEKTVNQEKTMFSKYMGLFLEYMRIKNYSAQTVDVRRTSLAFFMKWCQERGIDNPEDITRPIVERYQGHLYNSRKKNGEPLSFRTQSIRLLSLKMFFSFLSRKRYMLYNPASDLEMPIAEKRFPRAILTAEEVESVMKTADTTTDEGIRDRAILETFYSTGIRRAELANLTIYNIDYERELIMIRQGKGRKDRMVPVGKRALFWIRKYIEEVRGYLSTGTDEGILFLSECGKQLLLGRIVRIVRRHFKKAGIKKPGCCHLFRHTMATLMHNNGADIYFIQKILGHESLTTTQIYAQLAFGKLKEIHRETHPAEIEYRKEKEEKTDKII